MLLYAGVLAISAALLYPRIYRQLFRVNIDKMTVQFDLSRGQLFDQRFRHILQAFLTGHNLILSTFFRVEKARQVLETRFSPFYRGFAYEGTGMGFAVRSALFPRAGGKFEWYINRLAPQHVYQYYVGLGWYLQIRYRFRRKGYERWLRQLDLRYGPILFDGVGFRTGLFLCRKDTRAHRHFSRFRAEHQRVCWQGFGRSLWFRKRFEPDEVLDELEHLPPEYLDDAYSGLGLAVAYSWFDRAEEGVAIFRRVKARHQAAFAQGMAFGWEARRYQNKPFWDEQLRAVSSEMSDLICAWVGAVDAAQLAIRCEDPAETYYIRWMDKTRQVIREIL